MQLKSILDSSFSDTVHLQPLFWVTQVNDIQDLEKVHSVYLDDAYHR